MTAMVMTACTGQQSDTASQNSDKEFNYVVDQFADLEILRYKVPGFESLSLRQKQLLYHLSEAALMGRDIFFDQNGRYNLRSAGHWRLFIRIIREIGRTLNSRLWKPI